MKKLVFAAISAVFMLGTLVATAGQANAQGAYPYNKYHHHHRRYVCHTHWEQRPVWRNGHRHWVRVPVRRCRWVYDRW